MFPKQPGPLHEGAISTREVRHCSKAMAAGYARCTAVVPSQTLLVPVSFSNKVACLYIAVGRQCLTLSLSPPPLRLVIADLWVDASLRSSHPLLSYELALLDFQINHWQVSSQRAWAL
jgi:hypothetical protein